MTEAQRAQKLSHDAHSRAGPRAPQLDAGSYREFVARNAPLVFMFQTMYFLFFFFWRCSGMMLLGMALYKWVFLDGRLPARNTRYRSALPRGRLTLAGMARRTRANTVAMPGRAVADVWNYVGAVSLPAAMRPRSFSS